jgi:hypothetical protein
MKTPTILTSRRAFVLGINCTLVVLGLLASGCETYSAKARRPAEGAVIHGVDKRLKENTLVGIRYVDSLPLNANYNAEYSSLLVDPGRHNLYVECEHVRWSLPLKAWDGWAWFKVHVEAGHVYRFKYEWDDPAKQFTLWLVDENTNMPATDRKTINTTGSYWINFILVPTWAPSMRF